VACSLERFKTGFTGAHTFTRTEKTVVKESNCAKKGDRSKEERRGESDRISGCSGKWGSEAGVRSRINRIGRKQGEKRAVAE
jgi:hypothetical protein